MKTVKLLPILFIALAFVGCKENEAKKEANMDTVVEETVVSPLPRASDTYFELAINAYQNNDKPEALKQLDAGIDALEKESKSVTGLDRENFDVAKEQLRSVASKLDDNFDISIEGLKEAIANAEIYVAHNYLATDDVYVLTPIDKVQERKLHRVLDRNINNLEVGTKKLEGDAKREGEKLEAEGKKLKADFEAWKKRADDYTKRAATHFENNNDVYEIY